MNQWESYIMCMHDRMEEPEYDDCDEYGEEYDRAEEEGLL